MDGIEPALIPTTSGVTESTGNADPAKIDVHVQLTTGGQFTIKSSVDETADELQRKIARRLQIPKERMKVLYKEHVLERKTLKEYNITNGSKVTLLPSVKSGFSSTVQGTKQSVIQSIESLSDEQVDNFLSGSTPLTLAMSMGDHMMFIQLQLEQIHPTYSRSERRSHHLSSAVPFHSGACVPKETRSSSQNVLKPSSPMTVTYSTASESAECSLPKQKKVEKVVTNFSASTSKPDKVPHETPFLLNDVLDAGFHYGPTAGVANSWLQLTNAGATYLDRLRSALLRMPICAPPLFVPTNKTDSRKTSSTTVDKSEASTSSSSSQSSSSASKSATCSRSEKFPSVPPMIAMPTLLASHAGMQHPLDPTISKQPCSSKSKVTSHVNPASLQPRSERTCKRHPHKICEKHSSRQSCRKRSGCLAHRKISSASLLLHPTGITGGRIARQMQRLRRLCASHQRCVAYSSREVATEVSSIVRQAKHLRQSHHMLDNITKAYKSHKNCSDTERCSKVHPRSSRSSDGCSKTKIDSFTMHGPGIFSGTYSGSFDTAMQDHSGKLKRDPRTILQLLNDLLSATMQHKGNLNEAGILPRLLEDHFNITEASSDKNETSPMEVTIDNADNSETAAGTAEKPATSRVPETQQNHPAESTAKQSKEPCSSRSPDHALPLVNGPTTPVPEPSSGKILPKLGSEVPHGEHRIYKQFQHDRHHCCHAAAHGKTRSHGVPCRKHRHCQSLSSVSVKKLRQLQQENSKIRNKMKEIKQSIERKRLQRQNRKRLSDLNMSQQSSESEASMCSFNEGPFVPAPAAPMGTVPCEVDQ